MVHILGCDHYLQEYELQDCQEEIRKIEHDLKKKFYSVIESIICDHAINFVGEECKPAQKTIPRELAAERGCKYAEIDMSSAERERKGITKNYEKLGNEEQKRCNALREAYMVERVYSESTPEESKLIVCGALHIEGLASIFRKREREVIIRNVLSEEWCDLPWEKMMRGEL
jgi:hypothetical protein